MAKFIELTPAELEEAMEAGKVWATFEPNGPRYTYGDEHEIKNERPLAPKTEREIREMLARGKFNLKHYGHNAYRVRRWWS